MRALVVWESSYGNTRKIAESVTEGLAATATATAVEADQVEPGLLTGVDLVVVGAPTHIFGLPGPQSRAPSNGPPATRVGPGMAG